MARNLLAGLGVLLVLGLVAGAAAGLLIVKDRIRIVVQTDEAPAGPDPLALLRDDVQGLQRELGEVRSTLPGSLDRLGTALEERAESRHADVQALTSMAASLRRELASQATTLAQLSSRLDAVDRRLGETAAPAPEPVIASASGSPRTIDPHPSEPHSSEAPPSEAPPAEAKRTSFLSFSLPQTTFRFDEQNDYALVPDLCRVGFDGKSTLHDFTGVTTKVAGHFTADFDDAKGSWRGEVTCEAATLMTGLEGRDTNMHEHLDTEHHRQIRFDIAGFEPGAVDTAKQTATGIITGRMTIRGKTREVRMPIAVSMDSGKRIVVEGQMPLKLSDYEVPVPSQLGGTITMQDEVSVWIALRARVAKGSK